MAEYQYSALGKRFKRIRLYLNLTHEDIAREFLISVSFVYQIESGRTLIPNYMMVWLVEQHDVNLSWLIKEDGPLLMSEMKSYLTPNLVSHTNESREAEMEAEIANLKEQVELLKRLVMLNSKNQMS